MELGELSEPPRSKGRRERAKKAERARIAEGTIVAAAGVGLQRARGHRAGVCHCALTEL